MRRRWLLLRAAWFGLLASQVDHVIRLSSLRRGPLLGAAALALLLAPLALVLHHGEAVSRGQDGVRDGCADAHSVVVGAPIPLANGPVRAMTTPYYGNAASTMDLTLYCAMHDEDMSLGAMPASIYGSASTVAIHVTYAGYAHQTDTADF